MGTVILTIESFDGGPEAGSVSLAAAAGAKALASVDLPASEVDLLLNTGVFRDGHMSEPAMAPFVQRALGANAGIQSDARRGTLAFDILDGSCGFSTALLVATGFLQARAIQLAMVVASDVAPSDHPHLTFDKVGAAALLRTGSPSEGFQAFHQERFPAFGDLFTASVEWRANTETQPEGSSGQHLLTIQQSESFVDRCVDCASRSIAAFLDRHKLRPADIDLVVPSASPMGFAGRLAETLGASFAQRVLHSTDGPHVHSAGLAIALRRALCDSRYVGARRLLLVSVGAGITVSLALYVRSGQ